MHIIRSSIYNVIVKEDGSTSGSEPLIGIRGMLSKRLSTREITPVPISSPTSFRKSNSSHYTPNGDSSIKAVSHVPAPPSSNPPSSAKSSRAENLGVTLSTTEECKPPPPEWQTFWSEAGDMYYHNSQVNTSIHYFSKS
jgi:hypothetical protein